ncbi:FGGY-family carbohydrate kinase [Niveispirillum fermenti]|uniref:FGGY-family carbohydrate kinase n=1 Tax=Niveispirillum fermenti TaxID=1233113 RepID=UPI003A884E5B
MKDRAVVVLDIGKSLTKLSLWSDGGRCLARRSRPSGAKESSGRATLDTKGVEQWLEAVLGEFATLARVGTIVPVGHGAAAAILRGDGLACPPLDYEVPVPAGVRARYDAMRDPFRETGSPALPLGLNLGAQLFWLEEEEPALRDGTTILPWPQYWAWVLTGIAASEVSSLGCHTDLWQPAAGRPSALAEARGWAGRLAPRVFAGDVLGTITRGWAARTGLPADVTVRCGLHDSNAALLAARGFGEIAGGEATVLSTGTWFVAMRTPAAGTCFPIENLPEGRDCLANVDVHGTLIPSGRFMGGREIERLLGPAPDVTGPAVNEAALAASMAEGAVVLPGFAEGVGPFPSGRGCWLAQPSTPAGRQAAVAFYAALMADTVLDLVGAQSRLLVEGRFAESRLLTGALAALRPEMTVYTSHIDSDVSYGALRLVNPALAPAATLRPVAPLALDLTEWRRRWRIAAGEC